MELSDGSSHPLGIDNPEIFDWLNDQLERGFFSVLGFTILELTTDHAIGQMEVTPQHYQPQGIVHGGVYCSIVESLGSFVGTYWLTSHINKNAYCVGVHNSTNFFRPVKNGILRAEATPLHRGKSQQVWDVSIADSADKLVSQGQLRLHNIYQ